MRCALGVVAATVAAGARADAKIYHGSQCRPSLMAAAPAPYDSFAVAQAAQGGTISGRVALSSYFDCPIVRDVTGNQNGVQDVQVDIIASGSSGGTAECTLSALAFDGAVLASQTRRSAGSAQLSFGAALNASDALGYYHLACRLPSGWLIARYRVDEYGSGDDGAVGAAAGRDAKYYNAAEWCFPVERSARVQGGYFGYPPDGYTTRDPLTCPVVRDDASHADGLEAADMELIGPGGSTATCTLHLISADGFTVASATRMTSEQGPTALHFADAGPVGAAAGRGASSYIECSFSDARDWIVKGYRVVEHGDDVATGSQPAGGDRKTYTGSFCRPNLLDTPDRSYFLNLAGHYYQVTDTPQVLCPLMRDVTNNQTGLADIDLWIAAPGEGSVGCGLYMLDGAGAIVGQASRGVEFGAEGGIKKIDFLDPGPPIGGAGLSADQGAFGIACSLPRGFSIVGYMVEERAAGDSD